MSSEALCAATMPRISRLGVSALMVDVSDTVFEHSVQQKIWSLADCLKTSAGTFSITEIVPGMNNLLVVFDPQTASSQDLQAHILALWSRASTSQRLSREIDVPVVYGGQEGEDLVDLARGLGLTVEEVVAIHSGAQYSVACLGGMPGFVYLSGLPGALAVPRRANPRTRVERGAVIIGAGQAGVMPITAPSGWHILGHTDLQTFDVHADTPCLFASGDRVRFRVQEIRA